MKQRSGKKSNKRGMGVTAHPLAKKAFMKEFPVLYKRTSKGQVQTWQIFADENTYFTREGILNGKLTTSKPTACKPKNVGKKNETTGAQQALSEAASKHQKKLDKRYFANVADIDITTYFEPMLANKLKDFEDKYKLVFPLGSQPKLDGVRIIIKEDGVFFRSGKPVMTMGHIYRRVAPLFESRPDLVLDGEGYTKQRNFNQIISIIKQPKPTAEDIALAEKYAEFWCYDAFFGDDPNMGFTDREKLKDELLAPQYEISKVSLIKGVRTTICKDRKELIALYEEYLDRGYEGQMIRNLSAPYQHKRTNDLLKHKSFLDDEFELVSVEDGVGNKVGIACRATLIAKNGKEFGAGVIGDEDYARDLFVNQAKYIGKQCTVKYQNLTPDEQVPRIAKLKIVRTYE